MDNPEDVIVDEAGRWREHLLRGAKDGCPWGRWHCDCVERDAHEVNSLGDTALHWAACPGEAARLLAEGADINAIGARGDTPLVRHTRHEQVDLVALLVKVGADLDVGNRDGFRPIHYAARAVCWSTRRDLLTTLLCAGADPAVANNLGRTMLDAKSAAVVRGLWQHVAAVAPSGLGRLARALIGNGRLRRREVTAMLTAIPDLVEIEASPRELVPCLTDPDPTVRQAAIMLLPRLVR